MEHKGAELQLPAFAPDALVITHIYFNTQQASETLMLGASESPTFC